MTFYIPRKRRHRYKKPSGPAKINWKNSYAKHLVDFISPVDGQVISHVTGKRLSPTAATSFTVDDDGNEYVMGGQYVVDIPNYTDEFTVAVEAKLPTADGAEYAFRRVDGTKNFYIAYVIFNANIKARIIGNTFIDSGISSVAGQKYSALLCKKDGNPGILTTYSDNQFSEVTSSNNNTNDVTQIYLAYDSDVPVYFAATFNKALSGADYYDFLSAPYQVLQSRRKIFVLSSGAANDLSAAPAGEVSASGALTTDIPLAAAAAIVSTAGGSIQTAIELSADPAAVTVADGVLTAQIRLNGAALGQALATAGLDTGIPLAGSGDGAATATGDLSTGTQLAGSASGQASAAGSITTQITLQADALIEALASADLTAPGSGLAGSATVQASVSGALVTDIPLAGAAVATATLAGGLITQIPIAGAAAAAVNVSGGLTTQITFNAAALAQATATGDLTVGGGLSGAALIESLAGASLMTNIKLQADALIEASANGSLSDASGFRYGVRKLFSEPARGAVFNEPTRGATFTELAA